MLSGQPPFRGDTALSVALQHVRKQPERLENSRPDLPPALCRIVHKMLAKDPAERFQNPRELLHELRALQIEGVDLQWPAEMDEFNTVETAALGTSRLAATQRLQTMMEASTKAEESRRKVWYGIAVVGTVLASLLLGAAAAWAFRGRFLLDTPPAAFVPVYHMKSAQLQYRYAAEYLPSDEAAWQSVEYYFPDDKDKRYAIQAKEGLAKLYLRRGTEPDPRALSLFVDLANTTYSNSEVEKRAKALGLVGQSFIYFQKGNAQKSAELLTDLVSLVGTPDPAVVGQLLDDRDMQQLIIWLLDHNRKAAGKLNTEEWKTWLQNQQEESATSEATAIPSRP
jgi:serine/threonine-protein kinase